MIDLEPIVLSLKLSLLTSMILLPLGLLIALWRVSTRFIYLGRIIENLTSLPLILPPSVLGFYLLLLLNPTGFLGEIAVYFTSKPLVFTFEGILIGSVIYSLPFTVQPLIKALRQVGPEPIEMAYSLGAGKTVTLFFVLIPLIWRNLVSAFSLSFAHTMGEFGVILMIGGNIPGQTRTASIAIYDLVEQLELQSAHVYASMLVVIALFLLFLLSLLDRQSHQRLFL